jgi:hypothetical protein
LCLSRQPLRRSSRRAERRESIRPIRCEPINNDNHQNSGEVLLSLNVTAERPVNWSDVATSSGQIHTR